MLYNRKQVQEHFKIDTSTLRVWLDKGVPVESENGIEYFDVETVKDWLEERRSGINNLEIGKIYDNKTISETFGCAPQGGMRRSKLTNTLVLFSDHTTGIYDDKTEIDDNGNEILLYTGMGQTGDQDVNHMQNRTLNESNETNIEVYLFEAFVQREHIYRGRVELVAEPYQSEQFNRKVWIFPLGFLEEKTVVSEDLTKKRDENQEKEAAKLSDKELYDRAKKIKSVGQRKVTTKVYERHTHVSEYVKRRAKGHCDLCGNPAPFNDRRGNPFLECHHVHWLSRGGEDSIDNAVALDPSCHRKMHELDPKTDVQKLKGKIKEYRDMNNQA